MSRNKPLMASTPASTSKRFPGQSMDQTMNSQLSGEGDFTIAPSAMDQTDGDGIKFSNNRPKNSNWKRVKATLSRSQSHIVELFNRTKSKSRHQLNNKPTDLQTILPDEPTLLSVHKKPTTPTEDDAATRHKQPQELVMENVDNADAITSPDNHNRHRPTNYQSLNTIPRASKAKLMEMERNFMNPSSSSPRVFSGHSHSRLMNSTMPPPVAKPMPMQSSSSSGSMIQIAKTEYEELMEANKRLKHEYDIVWEDNRMLSLTFEDVQTRLKYFQDRNKYLEIAMYQEGKVLTDIIRACQEEIAILKDHECELLENRDDNVKIRNVELKIREYYMNKYANADESLFSDKVSGFSTAFLENLPEGIAE